jgi:hypothetical protein
MLTPLGEIDWQLRTYQWKSTIMKGIAPAARWGVFGVITAIFVCEPKIVYGHLPYVSTRPPIDK